MTRIPSAALLAVLTLAAAGCGDDGSTTGTDPAHSPELEFAKTGGCADAFFWATTEDDKHAVVVTVSMRERPASEPTVLEAGLPDPRWRSSSGRARA